MSVGRESFLARWARLKRAGGEAPPAVGEQAPALPDPETLGFDDDFSAFMGSEVEAGVRRVALGKLFHSAEFNVMDGLDVYIDDYTIASPIDAATLRQLTHAREMLFGDAGDSPSPEPVEAGPAAAAPTEAPPSEGTPAIAAGADIPTGASHEA